MKKWRFFKKKKNIIKIKRKGGAGSGNWGHAGRPGLRGGSAPARTAGMTFAPGISKARQKAISRAYFQLPRKVRDLVGEIEVHDEPGYSFEAGGKTFRAAGNWNEREGKINVFANASLTQIQDLMVHEAGHAVYNDWQRAAKEQGDELWGLPWADKNDPMSGALRMDGRINPNYPGIDPKNYGAYTQEIEWSYARVAAKPEDGVTDYSRAWNNNTETFAELYAIYDMHKASGSSANAAGALTRTHAEYYDAPTLGMVFQKVVSLYED